MTKEESDEYIVLDALLDYGNGHLFIHEAAEKITEFIDRRSKEQAIAFANWVVKNKFCRAINRSNGEWVERWIADIGENKELGGWEGIDTDEQLFELFIESQKNNSNDK